MPLVKLQKEKNKQTNKNRLKHKNKTNHFAVSLLTSPFTMYYYPMMTHE